MYFCCYNSFVIKSTFVVRLIDESLRWLIANGKIDRAKAILKKACKANKKDYNTIVVESGFRDLELRYTENGSVKSGKYNYI